MVFNLRWNVPRSVVWGDGDNLVRYFLMGCKCLISPILDYVCFDEINTHYYGNE